MNRRVARAWLLLAATATAGCKAGVAMPDYGPGEDLATWPDAAMQQFDFAAPPDLAPMPDLCPKAMVEVCGDGCDNDGNGYVDGEDPACNPIALVGLAAGDALRWTLVQPSWTRPFLKLAPWSGSAAYRASVTPGVAFVSFEPPMKQLAKVDVVSGKQTALNPGYFVRDVCYFGGGVIAVESGLNSYFLHQLKPDGTEVAKVQLASAPAACGTDGAGQTLYVAVHSGMGRSQFLAFDANLQPAAARPIPPALVEDRCLDFAWTKSGFFGLFAVSNGSPDFQLNATVAWPFAMDGGIGAPVQLADGGGMPAHSLGEFSP